MFVVAAATVVRPMNLTSGIAVHRRTVLVGRTRTVWMGARPPQSCTELVFRRMGRAGHRVTVQSCRARTGTHRAVRPIARVSPPAPATRSWQSLTGQDLLRAFTAYPRALSTSEPWLQIRTRALQCRLRPGRSFEQLLVPCAIRRPWHGVEPFRIDRS